MIEAARMFDRRPGRRPAYHKLLHEIRALAAHRQTYAPPADLPDGGGRPVLAIPAFLTGDWLTARARRYLEKAGFRTFGWELGVNWGPTPAILDGLQERTKKLARAHGKVALVGVSLGGALARNLAFECPEFVSHVVTVASPILLPVASTVAPLVQLFARSYPADLQLDRLARPLPVPSTMIYTVDDGIVAPENCWVNEPGGAIIKRRGPHISLASNPEVLAVIARRLAPVEGKKDLLF